MDSNSSLVSITYILVVCAVAIGCNSPGALVMLLFVPVFMGTTKGVDWNTDFTNIPTDRYVWLWRDEQHEIYGKKIPWKPYIGYYDEDLDCCIMAQPDGPGDAMDEDCNRPTHWAEITREEAPEV